MKETIRSIAERSGVSTTTVSRVLSGKTEKYRINKATAEKVMAVAKSCNFAPNYMAQSLSIRKSKTVGLLLPTLVNPFFAEMAHVAVGVFRQAGYTTILINTTEDEKTFEEGITTLVSRQVDGIIAAPSGLDASLVEKIDRDNVPVVLIDRFYPGSELSFVTTDNYRGSVEATRYLIEHGHRNIVCINGSDNVVPISERRRGYTDAMKEAGLENYISITGNDSTLENGYLETKLLLARKNPPSAIFALGNTIAMGAMMAIKEAGIKIPDGISLISFDNQLYLDFLDPALTRMGQPIEKMTRLAAKLLLDKMLTDKHENPQIMLKPELIEGKSVKILL